MKINWTDTARKQFFDLPEKIRSQISRNLADFDSLKIVKLNKHRKQVVSLYRARFGHYRIRFQYSEDGILIDYVGHRQHAEYDL